jgi:hypothetical protein
LHDVLIKGLQAPMKEAVKPKEVVVATEKKGGKKEVVSYIDSAATVIANNSIAKALPWLDAEDMVQLKCWTARADKFILTIALRDAEGIIEQSEKEEDGTCDIEALEMLVTRAKDYKEKIGSSKEEEAKIKSLSEFLEKKKLEEPKKDVKKGVPKKK